MTCISADTRSISWQFIHSAGWTQMPPSRIYPWQLVNDTRGENIEHWRLLHEHDRISWSSSDQKVQNSRQSWNFFICILSGLIFASFQTYHLFAGFFSNTRNQRLDTKKNHNPRLHSPAIQRFSPYHLSIDGFFIRVRPKALTEISNLGSSSNDSYSLLLYIPPCAVSIRGDSIRGWI